MSMTKQRALLSAEVVVQMKLCGGGCVCAKIMLRMNTCGEFVQNEGSVKGSFNCNSFSTLLELVHVQFDISRLCARAMLILLLIDFAECRGSYNESLRYFFAQ